MKILVTGGAGFIGSHLVEYHLNKGDVVIAIDNCSSGPLNNIKPFLSHSNFTFYQDDIKDMSRLEDIVKKVDRIYNMAAIVGIQKVLNHPLSTLKDNIKMLERILEICAALEKK